MVEHSPTLQSMSLTFPAEKHLISEYLALGSKQDFRIPTALGFILQLSTVQGNPIFPS